ncbi:MAG: alanine--tRNA ligase [Defluviitaleaceae bacterium]|nr:alanine--tRNA ligase [Defluviitaleaceae bacterium]
MKVNDIRELYLNFFEKKNHLRMKSASLVPHNDNSLLLINSGMAPLKPFFVGAQVPPRVRVTTCQKCIRTGDIENVGQTARHGTFFEMLGNFSFNDYFKEEAILYGYEFCTEVLKLPPEKIFVSIYQDDDEAHDIWHKQVGIPLEKIVRLGKDDNFWEVGLGPCGPCSELYYDRGEEYGCGQKPCAPGCDCDRFLEFWNLVFTQFNKEEDGSYSKLDRVNIDTGMGLERMAVIMQNVDSIFDVDTVAAIKNKVCEISDKKYGENHKDNVSLRIITDHMRSVTFMISDGVLPGSEGRGYVLRRLLRRAVRHGRQLGIAREFLKEVAAVVIEGSKQGYPELEEKRDHILTVVSREESNFRKTLEQGMGLMEKLIQTAKSQNNATISGEDAFKMYDTFGFPKELMEEILDEQGLKIDDDAYKTHMENQKQRARAAREATNFLGNKDSIYNDFSLTAFQTNFVGYDNNTATGKVLAIVQNNESVKVATEGQEVGIITDTTPIYPESGGQKGDMGTLKTPIANVEIFDCKKLPNGVVVHFGLITAGELQTGDQATIELNEANRLAITRNHTATHLLHSVLRNVLGSHVTQSGAEKSPTKLRFDFSHFHPIKDSEIAQIEDLVNEKILDGLPIEISQKPIDIARKEGAIALFGEKYDDIVRVVNIPGFSMELCGGTHVENTANIGLFKIISEGGIAQGVRRIEAVTGQNALAHIKSREAVIKEVASILKAPQDTIVAKTKALAQENKELKSQLESVTDKLNAASIEKLLNKVTVINGKNVFIARIDNSPQNALRSMGDQVKNQLKSCAVVLMGAEGGVVQIVVMATDDIVKQGFNAGAIAKKLATATGGSGGGRPNMATAQGKDITKLDDALEMAREMIV